MARSDLQELRRELSKHERGAGRRYPAALKQRAAEYAKQHHANGASIIAIASELGMRTETVRRWCNGGGTTALVPVEVIVSPAIATVAIVSPSGFRIEGLELHDAIAALRAIG